MGELSDFELLDAWVAGDVGAGSALFARHFDAVYRFFRNKIAELDVEDLVQRTFLGCIEGTARFRREASFRTFLFQVARFQLYAYFAARGRADLEALPTTSVRDLGTSPTGVLTRKQEHRTLLAALQGLPLDFQIMIELRYWEELTEHEIADVLGVPRGTVAGRLRRAQALLREAVSSALPGPGARSGAPDDLERWARDLRSLLLPSKD